MYKISFLVGLLCLGLIVLVVSGGTAMGDTVIQIRIDDQGDTEWIKLGDQILHNLPRSARLQSGPIILEGNEQAWSLTRAVIEGSRPTSIRACSLELDTKSVTH